MTETKLTDEEVICAFMEPKPTGSWVRDVQPTWWYFSTYDFPLGWHAKAITLDALWEVEQRLSREQINRYIAELLRVTLPPDRGAYDWRLIHATAAQKIAALASVLREDANG